MESIIRKHDDLLENKSAIEKQLYQLEKEYLHLLVKMCDYNHIVCDNCWQIVKHFKGANEHLYQKKYICKKRNMTYVLATAKKNLLKI